MKAFVIGLNHNTADLDVREKFAFNGPKLEQGLMAFREVPEVEEAIILSTCNRVELYANVTDIEKASEAIKIFLSDFHSINRASLDKSIYIYDDI